MINDDIIVCVFKTLTFICYMYIYIYIYIYVNVNVNIYNELEFQKSTGADIYLVTWDLGGRDVS